MDDLLPNDGQAYSSDPKITTHAEAMQRAQATSTNPQETVEWFEKQIARCDSLDNIETAEMKINGITYSRKVSIEAQILAQQMLIELLRAKMEEYKFFAENLK